MKEKGFIGLSLISLIVISGFLFSISSVSADTYQNSMCVENWDCTSWDSCRYGERERDCVDLNDCGTTRNKPNEVKYCDNDGYETYRHYCDSDNYYGISHPCYDIIRDDFNYRTNYYDNFEYEILNYYENKYNSNEDKVQIIQLSYPEDDSNYKEIRVSMFSQEGLMLIIIASILGILSIIIFIAVLVIIIRR